MGKIKSPVWIVQPSSKSNVWLMILLQDSHFFSGGEGEILEPTHLIQMNAGIDYLLGWRGGQASLDHQQQRNKKKLTHTKIYCIFCTVVLHFLSPEREKKKKVKQEVDKRRRGGKTERERERGARHRAGVCFLLQWKGIYRDTSDDETLFAVAPWQGIPQLLLKSLNWAGVGAAGALCSGLLKTSCQTFSGGSSDSPEVRMRRFVDVGKKKEKKKVLIWEEGLEQGEKGERKIQCFFFFFKQKKNRRHEGEWIVLERWVQLVIWFYLSGATTLYCTNCLC